jgi:hypothetical protein
MTDVLEWDARTLLEEYDGGGSPSTGERLLAEGLARAQWSGSAFRASLRDVPGSVRAGRLIDVLDPAAAVLESAGISGVGPALHGFLRHDMDRRGVVRRDPRRLEQGRGFGAGVLGDDDAGGGMVEAGGPAGVVAGQGVGQACLE